MAEHSINKYKYNNGDIYLLEDNRITFDNTATTTFLREDGTFAEPDSSIWLLRNSENGNYSITTDRENGYDFGIYAANNETVFTINEDQIAIELHDDNSNTSINTFDPTGIELGVSDGSDAMAFSMNSSTITLNNTSNTSRITLEPWGGVGDGLITLYTGSNGIEVDGDSGVTIVGNLHANGSNLTDLNATNLSSGTVNWNRLPTSRIYDANASRTANTVLAAPNGSAGAATFRALVAADIPALAASKITSGTFDAARIPALSTDKLTSGTLPIARGGTGLTASPSMLTNLGSTTATNVLTASPRPGVTGTLGLGNGGTGATTAEAARANLGTWALISDSYNTLMPANGTSNGWIKIGTSNASYGLLPSTSGAAGSGHNYIGTSSWYWKYAYIDNIYGNLTGSLTGTLTTSNGGNITIKNYAGTTVCQIIPGNSASAPSVGIAGYDTDGRYVGLLSFANIGNLVYATVAVDKGGTGATSFTSGAALIGNGTSAITTRSITNNTATSTALTANTNLITANTLRYLVNRTTSVAAADTSYTTYMARGAALVSSATNPSYNGQIAWQYE